MKGKISRLALALLLLSTPAGAAEFAWRLGSFAGWWEVRTESADDFFSNTVGLSLGVEGRTDIGDSKLLLYGINLQRVYNRQADEEDSFLALGGSADAALGFYLRKGEKLKIWAGPEIAFASWDGEMRESGGDFTLRRYAAGGAVGLFLTPVENWTLGGRAGLDYSFLDGHGKEPGSISGGGLGSYLIMGFDF